MIKARTYASCRRLEEAIIHTQPIEKSEKEVRDLEPVKGRDYQVVDREITGFAIRI